VGLGSFGKKRAHQLTKKCRYWTFKDFRNSEKMSILARFLKDFGRSRENFGYLGTFFTQILDFFQPFGAIFFAILGTLKLILGYF
jgi:hypothetical protein